jgi:hypothetical protein
LYRARLMRKSSWIKAWAIIPTAVLLASCWSGPSVTPLVIVTVESPPTFGEIGPPSGLPSIKLVSQTDLSIFFSQYEDDSDIPPEVLERYLTDPALMAIQTAMITDLIDHVQAGGAPRTPDEFFSQALAYTDDPGTALILCHNIIKAMARGRSPIPWQKQSEQPLVYLFDGRQVNGSQLPVHPDAATTGSRGQLSLFYRFFSPTALGQFDEGDWYHYYLEAATAYYGASGRAEVDAPGFGLSYSSVVGRAVDDTISQMQDSAIQDSPDYYGWRWANALSFLEEAYYGTDYGGTQQEAGREARDHMRGAIFGLSLAGYEATWPWLVPQIGSAGPTGVDVSSSTYETLDPASVPEGGSP